MVHLLDLRRARKSVAALGSLALLLVLAVPTFADETGQFDWATTLGDNLAGITAGVIASIAAVFAIAVLVRMTFKAARIALKSLNFIK